MRTNIPGFRLPAKVLDEEIGYIVGMGADLRLNTPIDSMNNCSIPMVSTRYFVGSGRTPRAKSSNCRGAMQSDRIHIGIAWLESVAFQHIDKVGARVLIIGVGNTAMDCCRTSLRLGAKDVKVMARKPRRILQGIRMGAGGRRTRERQDRGEPGAKIVRDRERQASRHDVRAPGVRLAGRKHHRDTCDRRGVLSVRRCDPCDRPGKRLSLDRARCRHRFDKWNVPKWTRNVSIHAAQGVFWRRCRIRPKNIIWSVEHGHQAAISIHKLCLGESVARACRAA